MLAKGDLGYINARRSDLADTVEILEAELIERNPDDDPERHPHHTRQDVHPLWHEDQWLHDDRNW